MTTLKHSSTRAKSGEADRRKGISHYQNLITLEKSNGDKQDTLLIRKFEAIIRCLEKKMKDEKK